jgi:hypothetical protein
MVPARNKMATVSHKSIAIKTKIRWTGWCVFGRFTPCQPRLQEFTLKSVVWHLGSDTVARSEAKAKVLLSLFDNGVDVCRQKDGRINLGSKNRFLLSLFFESWADAVFSGGDWDAIPSLNSGGDSVIDLSQVPDGRESDGPTRERRAVKKKEKKRIVLFFPESCP